MKAAEIYNFSLDRSASTGAIICALPFLQITHFFIDHKAFFFRFKTSVEQFFLHAHCLHVDCSCSRFERVIQL